MVCLGFKMRDADKAAMIAARQFLPPSHCSLLVDKGKTFQINLFTIWKVWERKWFGSDIEKERPPER